MSPARFDAVSADIKNGDYISKINKYFNEFYENQASFLDYMSDEYLLLLDEK